MSLLFPKHLKIRIMNKYEQELSVCLYVEKMQILNH